jgi:hypothetical protein
LGGKANREIIGFTPKKRLDKVSPINNYFFNSIQFKMRLKTFLFVLLNIFVQQTKAQSGLIAYYPFDGNANDISGNSNNGQIYGVKSTSDRFDNPNKAYLFNNESYINIGQPVLTEAVRNFSYALWIKTDFSGHINTLLTKRHDGDGSWYTLTIENNKPQIMLDGASWFYVIQAKKRVNDNKWHFIVATKQNNVFSIYVDGFLEGQGSDSRSVDSYNSQMHIGHHGAWNNYFNGSIDDVRIFNKALSIKDVQSLWSKNKIDVTEESVVSKKEQDQLQASESKPIIDTQSLPTQTQQTKLANVPKEYEYWFEVPHFIGNNPEALFASTDSKNKYLVAYLQYFGNYENDKCRIYDLDSKKIIFQQDIGVLQGSGLGHEFISDSELLIGRGIGEYSTYVNLAEASFRSATEADKKRIVRRRFTNFLPIAVHESKPNYKTDRWEYGVNTYTKYFGDYFIYFNSNSLIISKKNELLGYLFQIVENKNVTLNKKIEVALAYPNHQNFNTILNSIRNDLSLKNSSDYILTAGNVSKKIPQLNAELEQKAYSIAKQGDLIEKNSFVDAFNDSRFYNEIKTEATTIQRKEAEAIAEAKRLEELKAKEKQRQVQANSNKTTWTLGSKICNELDNGVLMGTINQWNENKSMAQIKIVAGPKGNYEGEEIKKGELIWVQASGAGWHVCLTDEIKTAVASDQSGKNNSGQMGGTTSNQQIAVRYIKSFGKKLKSTCLKKTFTQELQSEIQNIEYKEDTKMYVVKVTYSWSDKDFFDQYTRQIFGGVLIFDEYGCNSTFFISDKTESNLIFGTGSCAYKLDYNMIEKLKNVVPNAKYGMSMGCLDD